MIADDDDNDDDRVWMQKLACASEDGRRQEEIAEKRNSIFLLLHIFAITSSSLSFFHSLFFQSVFRSNISFRAQFSSSVKKHNQAGKEQTAKWQPHFTHARNAHVPAKTMPRYIATRSLHRIKDWLNFVLGKISYSVLAKVYRVQLFPK
ncbi:MAG TPA: hypothetical protein VF016_03065 [Nitrososphaera sp.]